MTLAPCNHTPSLRPLSFVLNIHSIFPLGAIRTSCGELPPNNLTLTSLSVLYLSRRWRLSYPEPRFWITYRFRLLSGHITPGYRVKPTRCSFSTSPFIPELLYLVQSRFSTGVDITFPTRAWILSYVQVQTLEWKFPSVFKPRYRDTPSCRSVPRTPYSSISLRNSFKDTNVISTKREPVNSKSTQRRSLPSLFTVSTVCTTRGRSFRLPQFDLLAWRTRTKGFVP